MMDGSDGAAVIAMGATVTGAMVTGAEVTGAEVTGTGVTGAGVAWAETVTMTFIPFSQW